MFVQLSLIHIWTTFIWSIDRAHAYPKRSFHSLVTLSRLAVCGLGPEPTVENLAHVETIHQSKHHPTVFFFF